MFPEHFRIIPLLILVAMMAFSFRLAEVVTGFSTLSGAAYAEEEVKEVDAEPPEMVEKGASGKAEMKEKSMMGVEQSEKQEGGLVFAEEEEKKEEKHEDKPKHEEEPEEDIDWRDASDSDLDYTEVRMELFEDLSKRRKEIEVREREMMARDALLKAAEQELDRKYQELSQLRGEIENLLQKQSDEEQGRVKSLVKIYEGMKPKDAARIFDTLDLDILVLVLGKMSERKLSPVMAKMNPERARTVTIMLAEQKQLPSLLHSN